jgi:hypothetical protein
MVIVLRQYSGSISRLYIQGIYSAPSPRDSLPNQCGGLEDFKYEYTVHPWYVTVAKLPGVRLFILFNYNNYTEPIRKKRKEKC